MIFKDSRELKNMLDEASKTSVKNALRAFLSEDNDPGLGAKTEPKEEGNDDVSVESVLEKLNTIRGGKSFKEEHVAQELEKYFTSLDEGEKQALYSFVKGIAEIVSAEIPASRVGDPSTDPPPGVKIQIQNKSVGTNKSSKKFSGKDVLRKKSAEDTSAPVPIVAKAK